MNWFKAAEKCLQINGNLVNLQNNFELENIQTKLDSSIIYWTDLNNLGNKTKFYSLTAGTEGKFLNTQGNDNTVYNCGILKYDETTRNFTVGKQKCNEKGRPICETKKPTTISVLLW